MGSRVSFINPRRSTRCPTWVPTRLISSYTVPSGSLYGSPCRNICPTLPPTWVSSTQVVLHDLPRGFLCEEFHPIQSGMVSFMGHHAGNFSPCWLTLILARDPIVSYAFPWIPMQSHAETHMGIYNRVFIKDSISAYLKKDEKFNSHYSGKYDKAIWKI